MALELELDPLSAHASTMAGMALLIGRRYEEAEHACREALDLQPDLSNAVWHLSFSLLAQSRPEHALDLLRTVRKATARLPIHRCLLGHALACAGQDEEARAVLEELRDRSRREYVSPFMLAKVHIGLGELDEALDQLEKTYAERSPTLLYLQRPEWDPLRDHRRFQDLRRGVGLPDVPEQ